METSTTSTLKIFAGKNVQVNKKPEKNIWDHWLDLVGTIKKDVQQIFRSHVD